MSEGVRLRHITDADLPIFFEQMRDRSANRMAGFTSRDPDDREAFDAHWTKIRNDATVTLRTILWEGRVVGHVGSFLHLGKPEVTYWIGKSYWGKGLATTALAMFLLEVKERPLYAGAAKDNAASIRVLEKCGFTISGSGRAFSNARGEEIEELLLKLA